MIDVEQGGQTGPWVAVTAVKRLALAKTRLELPSRIRRAIGLAMALDTVAVLVECPAISAVFVVSPDPDVSSAVGSAAVHVLADEPAGAGLNAALSYGLAVAARRHPRHAIAVLPADLPGLTVGELDLALGLAGSLRPAVVADAEGTGTVLLTQPAGRLVTPRFGPGSYARHVDAGVYPLADARLAGLCRDIDTLDDLARATRLGPVTLSCLDRIRGVLRGTRGADLIGRAEPAAELAGMGR